jgi:hypothetical protein
VIIKSLKEVHERSSEGKIIGDGPENKGERRKKK